MTSQPMGVKEFALVNFVVNQIANRYQLLSKDVYSILKKNEAIAYLVAFYDSINT